MGLSVWNVPRVLHYKDALSTYARIKPIRNLLPERRPLGARRDHHQYWVRMAGEVVEFMLYKTPVVTFYPDDSIRITTGGYTSPTTHGFIGQVLGIEATGWRGQTRLALSTGVHMLNSSNNNEVLLVRDPNDQGRLKFSTVQERFGYVFNRKAANNVRARYREFTDYFKAFVSLRSQEVEKVYWSRVGGAQNSDWVKTITLSADEAAQALGTVGLDTEGHAFDIRFNRITMKIVRVDAGYAARKKAQQRTFLAMIDPQQPEEAKHMNYYKAAVALTVGDRFIPRDYANRAWIGSGIDHVVESLLKFYDECLMMSHPHEVLTLTKLEGDKMPNPKYIGWTTEGEQA